MFLANKQRRNFQWVLGKTKKANEAGAIESLVFSEKAIKGFR
ncbi:MAG: hypothetical protein Ct9H300mP17_16980 [Candidatus Nitrosopelagicus sp.]|nr:MAG: hypothetical protein Ct9H300mP17_16980 [Candidatus Nitrosopelagicus sp.]